MGQTPILIITALLAGCSSVTPRENFEDFRNTEIGRHVDQISHTYLVDTQTLANENFEYKYDSSGFKGRCVYLREIDKKTKRVIAWRTEGDDAGCQIVP